MSENRKSKSGSTRNGASRNAGVDPAAANHNTTPEDRPVTLAQALTFSPEEAKAFQGMLDSYVERLEPRDQVEYDLVEEIVRAKWQVRKNWCHETTIIKLQIEHDRADVDRNWSGISNGTRETLATIESLSRTKALAHFQRHTRSLNLQAERALKQLT